MPVHKLVVAGVAFAAAAPALGAQRPTRSALSLITPATQSAPIANVRYGVTFDSSTAPRRLLKVTMAFDAVSFCGLSGSCVVNCATRSLMKSSCPSFCIGTRAV